MMLKQRTNHDDDNNQMESNCSECEKKEDMIAELYEKLQESALKRPFYAKEDLSVSDNIGLNKSNSKGNSKREVKTQNQQIDFDLVLTNISQLNRLTTENARQIGQIENNTTGFTKLPIICIDLFADGFQLDMGQRRFRPYYESASQAFIDDLSDGFFPAELQGEFPQGVTFLAKDRRLEKISNAAAAFKGKLIFTGKGRRLKDNELSKVEEVKANTE